MIITAEESKNRLLLKANIAEAEAIIKSMKAALARNDTKMAATLGLYSCVPKVKECVRLSKELDRIRQKRLKDGTKLQTGAYVLAPGVRLFVNRRG